MFVPWCCDASDGQRIKLSQALVNFKLESLSYHYKKIQQKKVKGKGNSTVDKKKGSEKANPKGLNKKKQQEEKKKTLNKKKS